MGVTVPSYKLKSPHDLPHMRKRLKRQRQKSILSEITLTSLIDIMSVVILFLIQSFSATGEVMMINKAIQIPTAQHGVPLERSPIITILADRVLLEGAPVGDNSKLNEKIEESDWDLPQLTARLLQHKAFFESIHKDVKFPAEIIIQADKNLSFVYLKRVMYALTKNGFVNINLAVRGEASAPSPKDPNKVSFLAPSNTATKL